jgi:uncharacterized membrane protein YhaH (DUF805 family)
MAHIVASSYVNLCVLAFVQPWLELMSKRWTDQLHF